MLVKMTLNYVVSLLELAEWGNYREWPRENLILIRSENFISMTFYIMQNLQMI